MTVLALLLCIFVGDHSHSKIIKNDATQPEAKLRFHIARSEAQCGPRCIVLVQTVINRGTSPTAVRIEGLARVTSLRLISRATGRVAPGLSHTQIGDPWLESEDTTPCTILAPGKSLTVKSQLRIPDNFPRHSFLSLSQEYTDFQEHRCEGIKFFQGS